MDVNISKLPHNFLAHFKSFSDADPRRCLVIDHRGSVYAFNAQAKRAIPWLEINSDLTSFCEDPEEFAAYLIMSARTRAALPGAVHFTDPSGSTQWSCHCGLAELLDDGTPILILRLQLPELSNSSFTTLNNQIDALNAQLEESIRANEASARLAAIVSSSTDAIYSKDLQKVVTSWNKGAELMFGYTAEDMIGSSILSIVPIDKLSEEDNLLNRLRAGEVLVPVETVRKRKDGTVLSVSITSSTIENISGEVVGYSKIVRDISERTAFIEQQAFLMQELAHRSKNQLAVISAISRQTARNSSSIEDFQKTFEQRLIGLSVSVSLLVERGWSGVSLEHLIRMQTKAFITTPKQLRTRGPKITVGNVAAETIGLAIHELSTNSLKYGAWSSSSGYVTLDWKMSAQPPFDLEIKWKERDGPPVTEPSQTGFGQVVIKNLMVQKLSADVNFTYPPEGVEWSVRLPEKHFGFTNKVAGNA